MSLKEERERRHCRDKGDVARTLPARRCQTVQAFGGSAVDRIELPAEFSVLTFVMAKLMPEDCPLLLNTDLEAQRIPFESERLGFTPTSPTLPTLEGVTVT